MKDNATLEDVLSALIKKHQIEVFFRTTYFWIDVYTHEFFIWQLNKPFSEQSEQTKTTLNKIL